MHLEFYNNVAFEMRFVNFDSLGFPSKILESSNPGSSAGSRSATVGTGRP